MDLLTELFNFNFVVFKKQCMIIFKSHFTHSPTWEKVTTSNHYNLTGNLCEKHVTQLGIEPKTFGLRCQCSTAELSNRTAGWISNFGDLSINILI